MRRELAGVGLLLMVSACERGAGEPAAAPRADEPARAEPIAVRRAGRELRLRCALSCEGARAELTRQQHACVSDPTSTPHHVDDRAAMIALGCCAEVEGAYAEACGAEGLEACVSRWSAECAAGRLERSGAAP